MNALLALSPERLAQSVADLTAPYPDTPEAAELKAAASAAGGTLIGRDAFQALVAAAVAARPTNPFTEIRPSFVTWTVRGDGGDAHWPGVTWSLFRDYLDCAFWDIDPEATPAEFWIETGVGTTTDEVFRSLCHGYSAALKGTNAILQEEEDEP